MATGTAGTGGPTSHKPVATHNQTRFNAYKQVATEFVDGETYDPNEIAHMLHDLRWDEVPRAFSVAINNAARRGPVRADLGSSFKSLVEYVVLLGFGSTDRAVVQPWFLQNWDFFFVSLVDGLLLLNQKDGILRLKEGAFRRAIAAVLEMIDGARSYMSLDRLADSTAVHALVVACSHCKGCFLKNGFAQMGGSKLDADAATRRNITLAHVLFMDVVAEEILDEATRDATTWNHAFGHYVGSDHWRGFAIRCRTYLPHGADSVNIRMLEAAVDASVRLVNDRTAEHDVENFRGDFAALRETRLAKRKREHTDDVETDDFETEDDEPPLDSTTHHDEPISPNSRAFAYQEAWRRQNDSAMNKNTRLAKLKKRPRFVSAAGGSWDSSDDDDDHNRKHVSPQSITTERRATAAATRLEISPLEKQAIALSARMTLKLIEDAAEPPPPRMYGAGVGSAAASRIQATPQVSCAWC